MDLNWSFDGPASFIQTDDSDVDPNASVQDAPEVESSLRPARRNGLLNIDDSDFEALIEILGTNAENEKGKGKERQLKGAMDVIQPLDNPEGNMVTTAIAPCVAPAVQSPSKSGPSRSGSKANAAHMHARPVTGRVQSPLSNSKDPRRPTSRSNASPPRETVESTSRQGTIAPTPSGPGPSRQSGGPTMHASKSEGFTQLKHQLGTSVSDVRDQVVDLRSRIQLLKDDVREFAPHLYQRAFENAVTQAGSPPKGDRRPLGSRLTVDRKGKGVALAPSSPKNGIVPKSDYEAISNMTEDEAKATLANICRTLHINPSGLKYSPSRHQDHATPVPPSSLCDITRALRLVSELDELVWRNANDQTVYNIYSEDNIQAILDRVRLWERTARSRVGRSSGL